MADKAKLSLPGSPHKSSCCCDVLAQKGSVRLLRFSKGLQALASRRIWLWAQRSTRFGETPGRLVSRSRFEKKAELHAFAHKNAEQAQAITGRPLPSRKLSRQPQSSLLFKPRQPRAHFQALSGTTLVSLTRAVRATRTIGPRSFLSPAGLHLLERIPCSACCPL